MIDAAFNLTDDEGRTVTQATYEGRWLLVFFGFTNCKVICPRNLAKLSVVLERIGAHADLIVPLYITVDPDRDTPERMKTWLGEHFPRFTGLTGDRAAIDAVRLGFRVFAQRRVLPDGEDGYDVPHTALTFLIDPHGRYRAHFSESLDEQVIADRILGEFQAEGAHA